MSVGEHHHLDHRLVVLDPSRQLRPLASAQIAPVDEILVVGQNEAEEHERIHDGVLEPSIHHLKQKETDAVSARSLPWLYR